MMKRIILITGPAGVGKTTVAEEWAKRQEYHTIHISLDSMRERVTSGFQHPQAGWNDETERQYQIARAACAAVAKIYYENDFTCIIDDAIFPNWPSVSFSGWQKNLSSINVDFIVLTANIEILQKRNDKRKSTHRFLPEDQLQVISREMNDWQTIYPDRVIDTSLMTIEEVVDAVDELLIKGKGRASR
jgi:broad-specificity NMP kinase